MINECDIKSGFDDNDVFTTNNWNCSEISRIRKYIYDNDLDIDNFNDDNNLAIIKCSFNFKNHYIIYVVVTYYKNRGRTGNIKCITSNFDYIDYNLELHKLLCKELKI